VTRRLGRLGVALVVLGSLLAACSSAPPVPDSVQDRKNRAADYLKFGRNAFQEAQFDQALSFYRIALDLDTAVDNVAGMAVAWNSVATAQTALGKVADARASLNRAEELAGLSGDRTIVLQVAVNLVQADLADKNTAAAQKRLDALKPFPSTAEGAALDHALGTVEKDLGHNAEALAAFDRAADRNHQLNLKQDEAANRYMKAAVLAQLDRWAEAEVELQAALALDKAMENTVGIGQDWRALGTVALKRGQPRQAFDAWERAYRVFEAANLDDQKRRTAKLLVPVADTLGLTVAKALYQSVVDQPAQP
jgi:tetratricopeptide (TPR) repeat protein